MYNVRDSYQLKGNFNLIKLVRALRQTLCLLRYVYIEIYFACDNGVFCNI